MDDTIIVGLLVNFLLIARAVIDLLKSAADNRLQMREKSEKIEQLQEIIVRLKSQKETISKKYYKLKEKYETTL